MDLIQLAWGLVWAASIAASALCSGVETGCYSLNHVRLDLRAKRSGDAAAKLLRAELERPEQLLATLLIGNNVVHYLSAESMHGFLGAFAMSDGVEAIVITCVVAPALFILGEAVPKELFRVRAEQLTYRFARVLWALRSLLTLTGILFLVRGIASMAERAAGLTGPGVSDARQRISALLKEGATHGVLSESQVTLLDRALAFAGVTAGDEMTPWSRVRALPVDADRARAIRLIGERSHARWPVVDISGKVVGVVRLVELHLRPDSPVRDLMVPVVRLKRTTPVPQALRQLAAANGRMAVVEDDSGRPVGLVTTRDLVEPLTGDLGTDDPG